MLDRYARFVARFRIAIIAFIVLLTGLFGYYARRVKVSSDLLDLAPADNRELILLEKNLEKYGSATFVMISVQADDAYSLSTLTKIKHISDELRALPEVEEVIDPLSATVFKYLFGMLVVKQSFPEGRVPESKEEVQKLKEEMLSEPVLKNVVVSENGETLAIYLKLKEGMSTQGIRSDINRILDPYRGPEKFYVAGRPIVESWVKEFVGRDSVRLAFPIVLFVMFVLFINFRSGRGMVLPLAIMLTSIIWTLGLMGIFGRTITMIGIMLPTLILVNSSSYSIHFLNQYCKDISRNEDRVASVGQSIVAIGKTIVLAAFTTIAGFVALTPNKIRPMMELGIFVLVGIFFSMALSMSFLPSLLTLLRRPTCDRSSARIGVRMHSPFSRLGGFVIARHRYILVAAAIVGVWSIAGIRNVRIDTSWQRFFKKSSEVIQSQTFIKSNFGGLSTLNISFDIPAQSDLTFKNLDALRYVDSVEQWVRSTDLFGPATSFVGYIKRANQLLNGNDPAQYRLPSNDAELLKILLMFKISQFTKSISNVVTEDFKGTNAIVRTARPDGPEISVADFKSFLKEFKKYLDEHPYDGIEVEMSGTDIIFVSLIDYLVKNQLLSIAMSIVIVFFIVSLTFRSFVFGFFSLIPIVFGLLLNFGTMSYFRVSLDFITAMISSIAVGMGVDNSIHYLIRFSRTSHTVPLADRLKSALLDSGIPIFYTSLTLIAGFSVLLFSSFKPILFFGLLISVTMLGCLIGVLLILPAFIYFTKARQIIAKENQ